MKDSTVTYAAQACCTENTWSTHRTAIEDFAQRLVQKDEVSGVVILGGMAKTGSRCFVDCVSDMDIAIVLSLPQIPTALLNQPFPVFSVAIQEYLPRWLPNFKFRVPIEVLGYSIDIDVHQLILEYERQPHVVWDMGKLEAYASTSEIYMDRDGQVKQLIETKIAAQKPILKELPIIALASVPVRLQVDVPRCLKRGLFAHAHEVINAVLEDLLVALYAVNGEFIPNRKWRLAALDALAWKPAQAQQRFEQALLVQAHQPEDISRRTSLLLSILDELQTYCHTCLPNFPVDPYTYASTRLFPDRQLRWGTHADSQVFPVTDQYMKMDLSLWNEYNWSLDAGNRSPRLGK